MSSITPHVQAHLARSGNVFNFREPEAAVVAFGLADNISGAVKLYASGGVLYGPDGVIIGTPNSDGSLQLRKKTLAVAADGAITVQPSTVLITKSSAAALTLASPVATTDDGTEIDFISTTAQAHTVTNTAGFGGGTTARDVATFGGAINDGFSIVAYQGVWYIRPATRNVTLG